MIKLTHDNVSYVKSGFRVIAGIFLLFGSLVGAGLFLILAEALGVLEELV